MKKTTFIIQAVLFFSAITSFAQNPGTLKWTSSLAGGPVMGSAAVGPNGSPIYITAADGYLYALDPATGNLVSGWSPVYVASTSSYGGGGPELIPSPAVASDGTIYVAGADTNVRSVSPSGNVNWTLPVGQVGGSGAIAMASNGTLYVTFDDDEKVYAVNPATMSVSWSLDLRNAVQSGLFIDSAPTVGPDGTIYLYLSQGSSFSDSKMVAIVDEDCSAGVKWITDLGFGEEDNDFHSCLVVDNAGHIYAPYGSASLSLEAFNTSDGSPYWGFPFSPPTGASIQTSPAIGGDGTVYVTATDGHLYALTSSGSLKWSYDTQTGSAIYSSPAITADGGILFGGGDGRLWNVKDANAQGTLQWTYPTKPSQPPLSGAINSSPLVTGADNAIYFGCANDNIYAVYGAAPLTNTFWPMFRKDVRHTGSAAPNTAVQPIWITGAIGGESDIYKGYTGVGFPVGGATWITLTRSGCGVSLNSSLQVTFLLGGDPNNISSTPYYDYNASLAYYQLDFTVSGAHKAPFPNGFYVIFQPNQTQITVSIQTVDSFDYGDVQSLWFTIPPNQPGYGSDPTANLINVHPDTNN